jgi:hypothetical protein
MTLRVGRAEMQKAVTDHLVRHPSFRLLRGMTQDNLNLVVAMVLEARAGAVEELKARQYKNIEEATHHKVLHDGVTGPSDRYK